MKDTKLVNILQKFSKSDLRKLKDFIHSPYFGASQTERDLFDFIYKYAPKFEHKKLTQEQAERIIFPNQETDVSKITRLQSRVLRLVEQFIFYHFRAKNSLEIEVALLDFCNKEKLTNYFKSTHRDILRKQKKSPLKSDTFYYDNILIENQYRKFQTVNYDISKGDVHIQKANGALDTFYFIRKLREFCLMHNRQLIAGVDFDMTLMSEILQFLPTSIYMNIPVVRIWYMALLLLKSEEKSQYHLVLTDLLEKYNNLLNKTDRRVLYTYLENTAPYVYKGETYYETLFTLYKKQLENGVVYIDGYLLPIIFKNIATVALRLGHIEWTENFVEDNKRKIVFGYENSNDVYKYSIAQIRFKEGKHDKVLEILNQTVFSDIYTKMDVRRMYMKVYYEEESDLFDFEVNNFRGFLVENKHDIPPEHVQAHRDFINICNALNRTLKRDTKRLDSIEERIAEAPILPEKSWLIDKLEALR